MSFATPGIHHVTAIAGQPQENIDFYTQVLGLRLCKVSVNQDDPGTYHFFYGDDTASPGTDLTFFAWPHGARGRRGVPQTTATAFAVPPHALDYWVDRLTRLGVRCSPPVSRFGEQVLTCLDPDGLRLELVATKQADPARAHSQGPVPEEFALCGFYGVTLEVAKREPTESILVGLLGFEPQGEEGDLVRYRARGKDPASHVDLRIPEAPTPGRIMVGTVHHVAWRVEDAEQLQSVREEVMRLGLPTSQVIDRYYFRSVYFREPGGILFEMATDGPGFTVDQPEAELGTRLVLPPFLESRRAAIEAQLPPVRLPEPRRR